MKAMAIEKYGGPEVLKLMDLPIPALRDDDVLVEVHATSVNPIDWKIRRGMLKENLHYQFPLIPGWDVAGVVKEVGPKVRGFRPGDEVYGKPDVTRNGAYAEYTAVQESLLAPKPGSLTFEEAASLPLAGITAWQAMVEVAGVHSGQKVLVHAGSGGVGSLAIQIAKAQGAHVAATTSGRNKEFVAALGADLIIDYEKQDFTKLVSGYHVVLDTIGGEVMRRSYAVLRKGGLLIEIADLPDEAEAARQGVKAVYMSSRADRKKLEQLTRLAEGALRPMVSSVMPLEEAAKAQEISETGHVRGKLVLKVR